MRQTGGRTERMQNCIIPTPRAGNILAHTTHTHPILYELPLASVWLYKSNSLRKELLQAASICR